MDTLSRDEFHNLAREGGLVPVYRQLTADLDTPVSVFLKLRDQSPCFLLESVEKAEQIGRYSFLGFQPKRQVIAKGRSVKVLVDGQSEGRELRKGEDPLDVLAEELVSYRPCASLEDLSGDLPYFFGGAVGYLGYDVVRFFERLPESTTDDLDLPDLHFLFTDTLVAFDHVRRRLLLIANVPVEPDTDLDAAYDGALERLDAIEARVRGPIPSIPPVPGKGSDDWVSNTPQEQYETAVRTAKEYIGAGDIFQVVLSQRLARETEADPFTIYRALRRVNPSPYMFFLDLGGDPGTVLVGSSPEVHVRLQGRQAEVRPIAGTRPRGETPEKDRALERELLADPKERAEHVMLVDLGRNDLGRVCDYGSVSVPDLLTVERYSHVIHLVSRVTGRLDAEMDAFDLMRATFPAGTVSGAPKVRAMEIVEELEPVHRGPYAGAVGYFGFNGNMDTCITIRTILLQGQRAYIQAGAGIVADSDPTREWEETLHKARALGVAIEMAEEGR